MAGFRMGEGVLRRKPIEQVEETEGGGEPACSGRWGCGS